MSDLILWAKALADSQRIRVIALLRRGELCVCELCDAMEISQSTLSGHLQIIRQAGLVTTRREGKWVYYGLEPSYAPLVETVFGHYQTCLAVDSRLQRDADRLEQRLRLRVRGCCTLGFGQVDARKGLK